MAKLFGTDGIRGTVNAHPMTSRIAMDVAVAAGHIFRENLSHRPTVLIAKDTRLSGYQIEPAITAVPTIVNLKFSGNSLISLNIKNKMMITEPIKTIS